MKALFPLFRAPEAMSPRLPVVEAMSPWLRLAKVLSPWLRAAKANNNPSSGIFAGEMWPLTNELFRRNFPQSVSGDCLFLEGRTVD